LVIGEGRGGDGGFSVGESGVRETVTEGEERGDVGMIVMSVADVEAFAVENFEVFAGPVVIGWVVLETFGEGGLEIISMVYGYKGGCGILTGSLPLGFRNPKRTSARAFPAS
jgi:hypothetical protein